MLEAGEVHDRDAEPHAPCYDHLDSHGSPNRLQRRPITLVIQFVGMMARSLKSHLSNLLLEQLTSPL